MAELNFNAETVDPTPQYEHLPAGDYTVQVVNSDLKTTNDGKGKYLWLELEILEGTYAGRKLFDRLNIVNANQKAVEIAQRTLSQLCRACGKMSVRDSMELHNYPVIAKVKVKPAQGEYDASNEIKEYSPVGNAPTVGKPAPQGTSAAPWQR